MAVLLRNVAKHNWGWFSREDPRMHLQTVEDGSRNSPNKVKVWLESKGKRTFELAEGRISSQDMKRLKEKVDLEREALEDQWVLFMFQNGWLKFHLEGPTLTIIAYPGSHNSYTRKVDLGKEYPGVSWDTSPMYVDLDPTSCGLLAVGPQKDMDYRIHIPLSSVLWGDGVW